jgi:hypothetical protein
MAGVGDVLGRRALNRATLERQLLLGRRDLPVVEPVLERSLRTFARATAGIDPDELAAVARRLLAERPLTRPALGPLLAERWPGHEPAGLVGAVPAAARPPAPERHLGRPRPDPVRARRVLARPAPGPPSSPRNLIERHLANGSPSTFPPSD